MTLYAQRTAGLFDESLGHRQAKAGSGSKPLGRKKRLARPGNPRRVHADASVGDGEPHVATGRKTGREPRTTRNNEIGLGGEGETPAGRHGVARVRGEVDQRRLKLPLVREKRRNAGFQFNLHIDGRIQRVDQDLPQITQQRGGIQRLGGQIAAVTKRQ